LSWKWLALGLKPTQSIGFAKEFIVLIVPILVGCTMFDYSFGWMVGQLGFCWLFYRMGNPKKTKEVKPKPSNLRSPPPAYEPLVKSSISVFRAFLQYATICAILAVDFHVFPRSFAKTETFGVSLMDIGVGGYVFSSGLVAGPKLLSPNRPTSLWTAGKSTFFVFLIGFGRILLTKFLGYQV
jgi:phosphatidylinositol glycan class W